MYEQGVKGLKMNRKNADPLVGLPSTTQRNYAAAGNREINMKVLKFRKRPKRTERNTGFYSLFVEGFILNKIVEVSSMSRNGQIPQEWAHMGGWATAQNRPLADPPDQFWRTLVADRGRDGKNPPVYYARACKESFAKGGIAGGAVNTTDLMHYQRNSVVAQFCRRVQAVIWNRALVKTQSGRLGLVGQDVRKGDHVCILYGCSVPVILRMSEKNEGQYKQERKQELRFLANFVSEKWLRYREKSDEHRKRKAGQKKLFSDWSKKRWELWAKDEEWHRRWEALLGEEKQRGERVQPYESEYDTKVMTDLRQPPSSDDGELAWKERLTSRSFNAWKKEKTEEERDRNNRILQRQDNALGKESTSTETWSNATTDETDSALSETWDTDYEERKKQTAKSGSTKASKSPGKTTGKEEVTTRFRFPEVKGHLIVDWETFDLCLMYYRRWKQKIITRKKRVQRRIEGHRDAIEKEFKEERSANRVPRDTPKPVSLAEEPIDSNDPDSNDLDPNGPVSNDADSNKPDPDSNNVDSSSTPLAPKDPPKPKLLKGNSPPAPDHETKPSQHVEPSEPEVPSNGATPPDGNTPSPQDDELSPPKPPSIGHTTPWSPSPKLGVRDQLPKTGEAKKRERLDRWLYGWEIKLKSEKKFAELAKLEELDIKKKEIMDWKIADEEYARRIEEEYYSQIDEEYWKQQKKEKTATDFREVSKPRKDGADEAGKIQARNTKEDRQDETRSRGEILKEYELYWKSYWSKIKKEYQREKGAGKVLRAPSLKTQDEQDEIDTHEHDQTFEEYKGIWVSYRTETMKAKTETPERRQKIFNGLQAQEKFDGPWDAFEQLRKVIEGEHEEAKKKGGIRKYRKYVTEEGRKDYNQVIRRKFWERLKEDGYHSWKFLGEAYVHGMMDGEAMKWQNENGIPPCVFELR
jgi:hypothetical protein